jgi:Arc/MetJ-type ribon-helix-helix transcriptional regulator
MPRLPRTSKTQTGYRIPPDIERRMRDLIDSGEFTNRADIINTAVRFWMDYRDFDVNAAIAAYLQSEEGERQVLDIIRKSRQRKK